MQEAEAVEFLLKSYPDYVTVESLPLENLTKQVQQTVARQYMMSMMMKTSSTLYIFLQGSLYKDPLQI